MYNSSMSITLHYKKEEYKIDTIIWDRDSYFLDFNNYWTRVIGSIAQKIAENTTDNWGDFNLIRTESIKLLGVNPESGTSEPSSPVNILPVDIFPSILITGLVNKIKNKTYEELSLLFREIIQKALNESKDYINNSIHTKNLEELKKFNSHVKQILITNDTEENNNYFLKKANLTGLFTSVFPQTNKEQISFLHNSSLFLTKNSFLKNTYSTKGFKNVLLAEDLAQISFAAEKTNSVIINIDGASKGNPGPASIGIVFYKTKDEIIGEVSEFIGDHTNNHAEYTALIKALEISVNKGYLDIEVNSDSELVVKQINKLYKVKDPDIKVLFDKAISLISKLSSFKITHVRREENAKADKLANKALST